jgi:3-oxoacyl-[acyl-carrier protein] reductase
MQLQGLKCLVTGGSRGIGLAIGKKFAEKAASVTLVARDALKLEESVSLLPKVDSSQRHGFVSLDIKNGWKEHSQHIQFMDIVVNCAGVPQASLLLSTDERAIRKILDVNLLGTILTTQAFLKPMLRAGNKSGQFLNISSILALQGLKGTSIYSASKAGVIGFTKAIAEEMGPRNIKSNCLCLGLVDTEMGRTVSPEIRSKLLGSESEILTVERVAEEALDLVLSGNNGVIRELR